MIEEEVDKIEARAISLKDPLKVTDMLDLIQEVRRCHMTLKAVEEKLKETQGFIEQLKAIYKVK